MIAIGKMRQVKTKIWVENLTLKFTDSLKSAVDCWQFFTYNAAAHACGLRNYTPGGRSFSFGNLSGLKNEDPSIWKQITNSVYVGMMLKNAK